MTIFVPLAMFGGPLLAISLFAIMPKRRAVLLGLMLSWLFLPQYAYAWPGPLKWTKINAVSTSVLLGVLVFDSQKLFRFRARWYDLPVLLLCLWPAVSAFANGLGIADAGTSTVNSILMYAVPYFLGRMYIADGPGVIELTRTLVLGGVIYLPLCLYELRMSPLLHYHLYGFFQHQWAQMVRDGGYRPIVFMQHGLAVAMWMGATTVVAYGLWRIANVRRLWGIPTLVWTLALAGITLECKSAGAIGLCILGCAAIEIGRVRFSRWILCILLLIPPLYVTGRATGIVSAERVAATLQLAFPKDRIESAADRLHQEDILSQHALRRPIVGWGPWGGFLTDRHGNDLVGHVDSMWIITLGKYGLVGVVATMLMYLLPGIRLFARKANPAHAAPLQGILQVIVIIPILAMIDNLSNFMPNPMFVLAAGAAGTLLDSQAVAASSLRRFKRVSAGATDTGRASERSVKTAPAGVKRPASGKASKSVPEPSLRTGAHGVSRPGPEFDI